MKLLFIISSLNSGGAERVLSTLANYWSHQGWEIELFLLSDKEKFYPLHDKIKIHTSQAYNNDPFRYAKQLYDIRKTVKSTNFDMVISFLDLMNIFTLLATIGIKTPLLISERNNHETLTSKPWRILRRITYPFTTGMVVLSQYDFNQYTYVKNKRIIVNPLDLSQLLPVNFSDKEKMMIAVGNLHEQKGFDLLIEAVATIKIKDWKLLILGEGKKREELTALIKQYKLEGSVFLVGRKSNIFDYYKKASIFILSSRYEGFPNVLNEAMAHGCTSIAFNCKTGPSDMIVPNANGILVEANNTEALAKEIEEAINNEQIREVFFQEAIKIREKNNLETIALAWETYIKELIHE